MGELHKQENSALFLLGYQNSYTGKLCIWETKKQLLASEKGVLYGTN
jgi:hypothetical protein